MIILGSLEFTCLEIKMKHFHMFLSYKVEVENQLYRKIKRVRFDRGANTSLKMIIVKMKE